MLSGLGSMEARVTCRSRHSDGGGLPARAALWRWAVWVCIATFLGTVPAGAQDRAADHYQRGVKLLEQGLWDPAIAEFEKVLKLAPEQAETYIAMGIALSNKDDRERALEAFRKAAGLQPDAPRTRFNLGLALRNVGRVDEAISELEESVRLDPAFEQGRLELALLLQANGDWDRSVQELRAILERNPDSALARNWLGVTFQQKKEFGQAITQFRRAVELQPNLVRAHNSLATILAETGEMEEAVEAFQDAVALQPDNLEIRMNLGVALRTIGESERAVEEFQDVLARNGRLPGSERLGPGSLAEVHHQIGQTLQGQDPEAAIAAYENALGFAPEKLESYYGLGQAIKRLAARSKRGRGIDEEQVRPAAARVDQARIAVAKGDLETARSELEEAIRAFPGYAPAYGTLGFVLGRQGDLDASVGRLRKAVSLDASSADSHYHLGLALWYSGQGSDATAELEEAMRLDPAMAEACAFLGMAYREQGRSNDARRYLQRAIALNREFPAPYVDLGVVFLNAGQIDWALGQFEAALNLPDTAGSIPDLDVPISALRAELQRNPDNPDTHNVLGRLLGKSGADPQQVAGAFREAIRLRPDHPEALNSLGLVLTQTDQTDEAIDAFRKAIRLRPDYAEARANLGGVLVIVDADAAITELNAALALNPGLVNAQFNLSRAFNQKNDRAKEIEHLGRAIEISPEFAKAHFALGRALVAERHLDEAVTHLERALELDPSLGEARYQLGLALVRAGRRDEAQRELAASRPLISSKQQGETATVLMREAQGELESGEVNRAVDKLRQVIALAPSYTAAHLALGEALSRRGDTAEAASTYRRVLELKPDAAAAFLGLGEALMAEGRTDDAIAALRDAARLRPSSVEVHTSLAKALIDAGNDEDALESLRTVVRLDPEDAYAGREIERIARRQREGRRADLLSSLVDLDAPRLASVSVLPTDWDDPATVRAFESEIRQGKFSQVEPRLRQYVADNPESWWGYYALGYVLFGQQKIGDSIAALAKSLRLNINNAEAHKILGRTLMIIGQYDRALIEFEQAARLKPDSSEIRYNLGKLYSAQDNFPAARREFEHALRLDTSYMEAFNALGFALESMNLDAEAVEKYSRSIQLNEERDASFIAPYVNMAAHHLRQNEPDQALEYALEAISIDPRSDLALFQAAKAFRARKEWTKAVENLESAVSINSRVSRYHYVLGLLYRRLGDPTKSRAAFEAFERLEKEAADLEAKRRASRSVNR